MFYWFAHVLLAIISKIFCPITVRGIKNIPPKGSCIIASNHISNLDPMILGLAFGRRLNYVAKDSLFKNRFFALILHLVGAFPIRRNTSDVRAIKEAMKRLKAGGRIVVFPEGTRKSIDGKKKIQPGIGLLAAKSHAVVVTAFIDGSQNVMPAGAKFLRYGRITVTFGKARRYSREQSYFAIATQIVNDIGLLFNSPHKRMQ